MLKIFPVIAEYEFSHLLKVIAKLITSLKDSNEIISTKPLLISYTKYLQGICRNIILLIMKIFLIIYQMKSEYVILYHYITVILYIECT